jgi:hypothetical protein
MHKEGIRGAKNKDFESRNILRKGLVTFRSILQVRYFPVFV